jgi:hypothetical protein
MVSSKKLEGMEFERRAAVTETEVGRREVLPWANLEHVTKHLDY